MTVEPIRCAVCNHDLTEVEIDGACPECGKAVRGPASPLDTASESAGAGLVSFICGLITVVTIWMPPIALIAAVPGVALAVTALKDRRRVDRLAVAGLVLCILPLVALACVLIIVL